MSADEQLARVAKAIEDARCPHREGPFGGYDYGYPDDKPVEGGRYVIRDFRDPQSQDWGKWLHQTDDEALHEAELQRLTQRHIAQAAIAAMQPDWRPIGTAPRDGTYILAIVAANDCRHLGHHAGRMFAIRHEGATDGSGYDMGWAVYPGYGGAPDNFFSAWTPLPAPPAGESV